MKKVILGLLAVLLLAGAAGCSNSQSSDKKMDGKQSNSSKMNMSDEEMKNMKKMIKNKKTKDRVKNTRS